MEDGRHTPSQSGALERFRSLTGGGPRYALQIAGVAAAYVVAGKLGLDLAFATSSVTAIWAPSGIALTALVLGGQRLWPAVALGALLTNLGTGVPIATVLGITLGNTLEAVGGAYLLRRVGFRASLERVRDVLFLALLAAGISTMLSATIGLTSLSLGDALGSADPLSVWRTWWLGDMGGDLIAAPLLMVLATHRPLRRAPGSALEGAALALALAGVTALVFSERTSLVYLVYPFVVWAALRFWQPGAAAASVVVAVLAVVLTARGQGPFAMSPPDDRLLLAQTFVSVAGITGLVLAAVTSQRGVAEQTMRKVATTLQESLLPAVLPEVPNLRTATYFRPAGHGERVGGDFYDLFQAGGRTWALAVGDVCGKGAPAAALTALARHTLRAAAVQERLPSRVLGLLNDSIRRQTEAGDAVGDLCTAVYATIELNGSSATVTLACGGHPLPLLLHADGHVAQVGTPGMLLGADPRPPLRDETVRLAPGEAVVFYTDGLTDAYAPERVVQVSELESVLESCAGLDPPEIIAAIEGALLRAAEREPRDDIAIVVVQLADPRAGV